MASPQPTVWALEPHTAAKHDMLRRYLAAWFPILFNAGFGKVTYAEGFAGPGEYIGDYPDVPGSPLIALDQLLRREPSLLSDPCRTADFLFVEHRQDRIEHLEQLVQRVHPTSSRPRSLRIRYEVGECADRLEKGLTALGAWGKPVFANLDQWGGTDVPETLVRRIAGNRNSEVLVTLTARFFIRFAESPEGDAGDRVFGTSAWRKVAEQPGHKKRRYIVEEYRRTLKGAGLPYTLAFEMLDVNGHDLYLIFGTRDLTGLDRMKAAMWKIDPIYGIRFRDPRDEGQSMLEITDPDTGPLNHFLMGLLAHGPTMVETLRDRALVETVYRREHVLSVLRQRVHDGTLVKEPLGGPLTKGQRVRLAN